jgi:hypothetical protein
VRRGEAIFAELGLDDPATTPAQLIAAMVDHSILIERPVVLRGDRAVIARPPDRIVELVDAGIVESSATERIRLWWLHPLGLTEKDSFQHRRDDERFDACCPLPGTFLFGSTSLHVRRDRRTPSAARRAGARHFATLRERSW